MVHYVSHGFLTALNQLVTRLEVVGDEFFLRDKAVSVDVDLVKDFLHYLVVKQFVLDTLAISEKGYQLTFRNIAISVVVDLFKLSYELLAHAVLYALLLNTLVD